MRSTERLQRRVLGRRKSQPLPVLGVALEMAMAGLMLTLLIIVMLAVGFQPHSSFAPDLAAAKHAVSLPGATREDAIRILVTRDGALYFRSGEGFSATRAAEMEDQVRTSVRAGSERRVYVMVDERARYGDVETVIDAVRAGGIWNMSFIVGMHEPLR